MTVTIRVQENTDLDFIHSLFNDPDVMKYWFAEPYLSRARLEELFAKNKNDEESRRFIIQDDEKPEGEQAVGIVELVYISAVHRTCEFQIIVAPGNQGRGYAHAGTRLVLDYAFDVLNLRKVWLLVDTDNAAAIHVYGKAGFQVEGVQREEFYASGTYRDATRMAVFAHDRNPD